jgi:precorrin-3B C17-methyltransferase
MMNKIYVVGLGPGDEKYMTGEARAALENCELICGYSVYVDLVSPLFPQKPVFTTPMTREIERCRTALSHAAEGRTVAMVCSGDAGVYGMAGLIYELSSEYPPVEIEVVSGVTAALSGAAVLGAPLSHDFAVISLSDLLTDWELIEKRLELAAQGDFCLALYNPASKKRAGHLSRACAILLKHKSPETVCGWVRNIGRDGESFEIMSLRELQNTKLDMFCTVFVGNTETKIIKGRMVTPRGYEKKL